MKHLSIDIETYSSVDIKSGGAYKYALSPDFEILLFGYSVDFGPAKVVDLASGEAIPKEITDALLDPDVIKHAYNAAFEWWCLSVGWMKLVPTAAIKWAKQWHCTMLHAMYLGYPAGLKMTGKALDLSEEQLKSSTGTLLINYFCKPCKPTKRNGGRTRNRRFDDTPSAEKWEQFKSYNRQDVEAEMAIYHRLAAFPVPEDVQEDWVTDLEINSRGFMVDDQLVDGALEIHEALQDELIDEMIDITELNNPNSNFQLAGWLELKGHDLPNLQKATVEAELEKDDLDWDVRRVLELKQELAKTSVKKYTAMKAAECGDSRVRGLLQFYGGNRTGRWAGRLVQVQNLPRVSMSAEMLDLARGLVKKKDKDSIELIYGSVSDTLSQLIRTAFIPEPWLAFHDGELMDVPVSGKIVVADFSAIEARVIAWLAQETWRQQAFKDGKDIYCASASQMFHVPVEKHGVNGELRQKGKVAELALGYQGWTGAMIRMGALDKGLTEEELPGIVLAWREASPHIVSMWKDYNNAAMYAVRTKTEAMTHWCTFRCEQDPVYGLAYLTVQLPSGRKLFYPDPQMKLNDRNEEAVHYMSLENHQWVQRSLYGGLLTENITQATARDCLQLAINRVKDFGSIVAHVHDEIICEYAGEDPEGMYHRMVEAMSEPVDWAPGLILSADGFISDYYTKE